MSDRVADMGDADMGDADIEDMAFVDTSPTPSLWWQHAGHEQRRGSVPLGHDLGTVDTVVVGAGVVGLTAAVVLAERGQDVVVLDAARVGAGATGHSTAKLTALQSPRYARLERDHGPEAARTYASMTVAASAWVRDDAPDATERTAVTWTGDASRHDELEAERAAAVRAGLDVRWVEQDETALPLSAGIALDGQHQYDPLAHLHRMRDRLLAAGGRLHEASPVRGVSLVGERRSVTAGEGIVAAPHVIVATGLPILDRGGWFARLEPRRSYAVAVVTDAQPRVMGISIGDRTRSSRDAVLPDGTPVTVVAGGDHRTGTPHDDGHDALAAWAADVFGGGAVVTRWSAQDWRPADGLPLAGPVVPGDGRVLAASGFDKWGLTSGTAAAHVLARRVLGEPPNATTALMDPARLRPRAAAGGLARHGGLTAWYASRGWLRAMTSPRGEEPAEGEGHVVRDGVRPVAESRVDGELHRCLAVCPHLGGVVAWDAVDRGWACPLHGSRFAPDGAVRSGPATRSLRDA